MQITDKAIPSKNTQRTPHKRSLTNALLSFALLCSFSSAIAPLKAQTEQENDNSNNSKYPPQIYEYLQEGSDLLKKGNFPQAKVSFEKALKINGRCFEAHNNIGLVYYRSGDLTQAANAYEKAIDINPTFLPSLCNLAVVRYKLKQYAEAESLYKMALRLTKGKDAKLSYSLGNVLRDQKRYD